MEGSTASVPVRAAKVRAVVRVASGNFLEMYDFMVFGYYAPAIARAFFPARNAFASLMLSLMTFGAGFLMRPLGAVLLGAYIDHHGRPRGLIVTLSLMAAGTLSIALVPGYDTLGLAAPLLVVLGRLLQGFSAGAELGGVSVYLSEIATPGNKGFYVSWQSASQQVAVVFAASLGVALHRFLSPDRMEAFGWRVPLLVGCAIVPVIFAIRRSLPESDEFLARKRRVPVGEIFRSLLANWRVVFLGVLAVTMTTVSFYTITAYTPTFGREVLRLSSGASLAVTLCVGLSNLVWLPVMGALSDRVGRRPLLVAFTILALTTAYPTMAWLVASPSFDRLLAVELWLSFLYGGYNGALVVYLTEIMPVEVRTAGFSLSYSIATAVFGGFTPALSTWLIHATGNPAMPGAWIAFAAACGLSAALALGPRYSPRAAASSPR
ncbi:MAG TPA: MFS transporter [Anaeromyxobacteraceae bacterium]|nr:MFS transporter [Anaeromyxobacteraceae bacterium]